MREEVVQSKQSMKYVCYHCTQDFGIKKVDSSNTKGKYTKSDLVAAMNYIWIMNKRH